MLAGLLTRSGGKVVLILILLIDFIQDIIIIFWVCRRKTRINVLRNWDMFGLSTLFQAG
jgi:hypothetical protein